MNLRIRSFPIICLLLFSGGLGGIVSSPKLGLTTRQALSAKATLSLGKWFTSVSGLRISGTGMDNRVSFSCRKT